MRKQIAGICCLSMSVCLAAPLGASAHEFWLDPNDATVETGSQVALNTRIGQDYAGSGYPYNDRTIATAAAELNGQAVALKSRLGDRPALQYDLPAGSEGLMIVTYETTSSDLSYANWQKFENFVTNKQLAGALENHLSRGLPKASFHEIYSRHAKSLIVVGNGDGKDREVGLLTEIVALANPYRLAIGEALPVKVLYQGQPRAEALVDIWTKQDGEPAVRRQVQTNADGIARIALTAGADHMLDAVVMRPLAGDPDNPKAPVWESLWASLTFELD